MSSVFGSEVIVILTTGSSSGGAHESKSDKKEHVTVNYEKSNGDHVTTKHVYV